MADSANEQDVVPVVQQVVPDVDVEYVVERIIDRRIRGGVIEYLIKWDGFDETQNTWESEENCKNCAKLVAKYEDKRKKEREREAKRKMEELIDNRKREEAGVELSKRGFERALEPEKIVGATDSPGTLWFLINWKDSELSDLVPAEVANKRCPQLVIEFFEERVKWCDLEDQSEDEDFELASDSSGFDLGVEPEKIVQATMIKGELLFLMKWKNSDEFTLALARDANERCPQIVIDFYQEHLSWHHIH